ncbi:glycosyltransferase family 2 protein [Arthrobacter sp. NPDC057388]|uniref:glycosyltransferase family 2 protein n=1 Tax=Arthrobacter sp. NPDC057388 TaxID=3346116 RepID=UPI0036414ACE
MSQSFLAEPSSDVLVTVIVPVFNTPPVLIERAVVSVLNQSHPNLELLIVDDGSAAEIAGFLDRTAERDPRMRVVHRENGGVSAARNTGVDHALGDFIAYLDADDYLETEFLASALTVARTTDADAVFGGIRVLHEGGSVEWRTGGPPASDPLLGTNDLIVTACIGALSDSPSPQQPTPLLSVTNVVSSLHKAANARRHRFPEGVSHAEDRLYNLSLLLETARVAFCSDVWYVYDQTHDQGVTRHATPRTIAALARTTREFARVGRMLGKQRELSANAHDRITRAAAEGVLNYLKVLTGVLAVVPFARENRLILRALLEEPSVHIAVAQAKRISWKDQVFAYAAYHGRIGLLRFLGRLWVRSGGLGMSAGAITHGTGRKS